MNAPTKKEHLLQQIAAIPAMERGKLSSYSFKERPGITGPYHKLQHWEDGKNKTRYVPADQVPALEAALAGYAQYQRLTEEYAQLVIAETRRNLATLKKTDPTRDPPGPRRGDPTANRAVPIPGPGRKGRRSVGNTGAHSRVQIGQ
jgi:hypothetical protein